MRLLAGLLAAVVLTAAAGCAQTTNGNARWDRSEAAASLPANGADQVLLVPAELSQIVGVRLAPVADKAQPIPGTSSAPDCSALDTVGTRAFVGDDWTSFRLLLVNDGEKHQHVDAEAVAVYSDARVAATVFTSATKGAHACDGEAAPATDDQASWRFAVNALTPDQVLWNKEQTDAVTLWVCYGGARVRVNTILQAMSCQGDDGGKGIVAAILDRLSANVWDRSVPG